MHETMIAAENIRKAEEQGKVKKIVVDVGDLGHLPAHELEECIKNLVTWEVVVNEVKAVVKCRCGYEGEPKIIEKGHDSTLFVCPECGDVPGKIVSGDQIVLKEVEVE